MPTSRGTWTRGDYGEPEIALIDVDDALADAVNAQREVRMAAADAEAEYKRAYHTALVHLAGAKMTADTRRAEAFVQTADLFHLWKQHEAVKDSGADLLRALDGQIRARQTVAASVRAVTTTGTR